MKKQTAITLIIIVIVLAFFVTPLGNMAKIVLMRSFSSAPAILPKAKQTQLLNYNWRLRDDKGNFINLSRSKGRVVLINFWATWHAPSTAELKDLQKLYTAYRDKVDFYIITNEEQQPVNEFLKHKTYTFPVSFRIPDKPAPFAILEPSGAYLIDRTGSIVVSTQKTTDWYNTQVTNLLDSLVQPLPVSFSKY